MSIQVREVLKYYGKQRALDRVSFDVKKGEIVGFLGPNGAGKSTMMKIITCYLPQSSGDVSVCDLNVQRQAIEVRKKIGYLPEHNPLYLDMYVREFLSFCGEMHNVRKRKARVEEIIELVGLRPEANKKIEALSKGYRQRVGLAQALIHDPEVLILDEPTTGLDPNQLAEIRQLIKRIGKEKTVLLSTHIMQEVEAICDRTIIIHQGRIVADAQTNTLRLSGTSNRYEIELEIVGSVSASFFTQIEGVESASSFGENKWTIVVNSSEDLRPAISSKIAQSGNTLISLTRKELKLEDVFKVLTSN
jgi:ABC-2 type transport system ATP-binding protein